MKKNYQRETELLEFSRNTNMEELKKSNNDVTLQCLRGNSCIAMASLRWHHCIGFFVMVLASPVGLMFRNKAIVFLGDELYRKTSPCRQELMSQ